MKIQYSRIEMVRYEISQNILSRLWIFFIPAVLALQVCIQNKNMMIWNDIGTDMKVIEYYGKFLEGIPSIQLGAMARFQIPGNWLLFFVVLIYINGKSSKDFVYGMGMQILIRSRKLQHLWFAKWVGTVIRVILYYLAAYVAIGLFCLCFAADPKEGFLFFTSKRQFYIQLLLPIAGGCVLCIWQILISVFTDTLYGMLFSCVVLIVSAYFDRWYLIGNYLMKLRTTELFEKGLKGEILLVYVLLLGTAAIWIGNRVISKVDYLRGKGD